MGIIHNSPLPVSLLDYGAPRRSYDDKTKLLDKKKTDDTLKWWKINPDPVANWFLPTDKKFKEFFDLTIADGRTNVSRSPKVCHHTPEVTGL